MFGDEFGLAYALERHAEMVQVAELQRLVRCQQHAERGRSQWSKRVLATAGRRLVTVGARLQSAAAH